MNWLVEVTHGNWLGNGSSLNHRHLSSCLLCWFVDNNIMHCLVFGSQRIFQRSGLRRWSTSAQMCLSSSWATRKTCATMSTHEGSLPKWNRYPPCYPSHFPARWFGPWSCLAFRLLYVLLWAFLECRVALAEIAITVLDLLFWTDLLTNICVVTRIE